MSTFKFVAASQSDHYGGGIPDGFLFNLNTLVTTDIPFDTTVLDFTGTALVALSFDGVTGGAGDDILTGMGEGDTFHGGDGNDTISGGGGADRLDGGRGANVIDGGSGFDTASADFSDRGGAVVALNGGVAGVTYGFTVGGAAFGSVRDVEVMTKLTGGGGDDRLGGAYALTLFAAEIAGGFGTDTAVVDLSAQTGGSFSGGLANGLIEDGNGGKALTLNGIEALEFTGNATGTFPFAGIAGGDFDDVLTGLDGNDVFAGGGGADIISGGKGNDTLRGGTGANAIEGGDGNDVADASFAGQSGDVVAVNLAVADTTYDFTVGGAKHGHVRNVEMMIALVGGTGNDRLGGVYSLTARSAEIGGGFGTDTAVVDLSGDVGGKFSGGLGGAIHNQGTGFSLALSAMEVLEFTGNATGTSLGNGIFGGNGRDILTGLGGNDTFTGGAGADLISGGKGDDSLFGGVGANDLDGGEGFDIGSADFSDQAGAVVAVNGGAAGVTYGFTVGGKAHGSVRDLEMMADLVGGKGGDRLGGTYDLTKRGAAIAGGDGVDTAVVVISTAGGFALSGGLGAGVIFNQDSGFGLTLKAMEVLEFTGNAAGSAKGTGIAGGAGDDILTGLGHGDFFSGGGGADIISGAGGDDTLLGGLGANVLDGGEGFDVGTADFSDQAGDVVAVYGADATATYGFTVAGKAHGSVRGIETMAVLTGGTGDDRMGGFYDQAVPNTTIDGGVGRDTAVVDLSADPAGVFSGGLAGGKIELQSGSAVVLLPGIEVLEYHGNATGTLNFEGIHGGIHNDILTGLALDDVFHGKAGADRISGGAGNDRLYGEGGADQIDGGAGFDIASFDFADQLADIVAVNGGQAGSTYEFTLGGAPLGWVKDVELVTSLIGGTGNDRLGGVYRLDKSNVQLTGGLGTDTAVVDLSSDTSGSVSGGPVFGSITNKTTGFTLQLNGFEALEFVGTANNGLFGVVGGGGDDILTGMNLADIFSGGGGNDRLRGNGGDDQLFGNAGIDTAFFSADFANHAFFFPALDQVEVTGPQGSDELREIEILEFLDGQVELVGGALGNSFALTAATISIAEGHAGTTAYAFTVSRTGAALITQSIGWSVAGIAGTGTVPAGAADFAGGVLPSGTVTFAPGETSRTITVAVAGDTAVEANERFAVSLANAPIAAKITAGTAQGIIRNDDALLSVASLAANNAEGNAGSTAFTFTVTRSGDTSVAHGTGYQVVGSGAAPADAADFAGAILPSGVLNFAPGQTSRTLTFQLAGDTSAEADEGFTVNLMGPSVGVALGKASATGTIFDDDTPGSGTLSIARLLAARSEGQTGSTAITFTVTRSGDKSAPAGASWAVTGGGVGGTVAAGASDFFGGVLPTGVVRFAAGETSRTVTVFVAGDTAVELNESFTIALANPLPGVALAAASATGVIYNDDTPGTGTLSIARASAQKSEGHSGTTPFTFTVTRSGTTTGTASADWAATGGGVGGTNPANGGDFAGGVLPSGRVSFAAGQTSATVALNVAGDIAAELNDSFTVTLSGAQAGVGIATAAATGVILNDDAPPTGQLSIARLHASRAEGQAGSTGFSFVVTRSGIATGPAGANWTLTPGGIGGTAGVTAADFVGGVLPSGTVLLAAGETSRVITVAVAGDAAVEFNESFTVTLAGPPPGVTLGTASATGLVWNDDTAGTGTLAIARSNASRAEGNSGSSAFTFTVTRSGDLSGTAGADYAVTGGGAGGTVAASGTDFAAGQLPAGHIAFAAGQASQVVSIPVAGETAAELNESFTVTLSAPQAGVSIATAAATGIILDDDTKSSTGANETLTGTSGPDLFLLGGGLDTVFGLAGLDRFRFQPSALGSAAANATTMADFSRAAGETLDLSLIDAIAGTGANDAFSFIGTAPFGGSAGQLRWSDLGAQRLVEADVNGDSTADLTIFVQAAGPLDANWFVL